MNIQETLRKCVDIGGCGECEYRELARGIPEMMCMDYLILAAADALDSKLEGLLKSRDREAVLLETLDEYEKSERNLKKQLNYMLGRITGHRIFGGKQCIFLLNVQC